MSSNDELACVYAALILLDDDLTVTAEKINSILKAANVNVEPYWPGMFAKASQGLDLRSIANSVGVGGGGGAPVAAGTRSAPAAVDTAPAAEAKKEEAPQSEESDDDMGFSLFG
ncbi:hypothetical protein OTU49_009921 [Cherax quadricarinatus]|uniref:Large ribosomal subunit protein P1 n=1 Tax=Cherax quadricarinatus TaxID=27406 RepID=A0AAW0W9F3_CHEQU|nr:60S acidic ribosomal protein P1-like [Cherax quadricarinatus]XP_053651885.1 60S acidic ribosomal protein P1-like [Cherax quadricarinatus]TOF85523.1 hypothetical protein CGJ15_25875 [Vibrio parahaemolyticus]